MSGVVYRKVARDDVQGIKDLHIECFPIRYEDVFFENVCNGKGFKNVQLFTLVAVDTESSSIVGCILGQFVNSEKSDDGGFFSEIRDPARDVFYILTLGLRKEYRRSGIGTALLLLSIKHAGKNPDCGAVYLHVIHDNKPAINFYERNGFNFLRELDEFYNINDRYHSSYLYILYINGYEPPLFTRLFEKLRNLSQSGLAILISWTRALRPLENGFLGKSTSAPLMLNSAVTTL